MRLNTEKIREARKLKKIREQCKKIWESDGTITLEDIPYRGMGAGDILDAMLKVRFLGFDFYFQSFDVIIV